MVATNRGLVIMLIQPTGNLQFTAPGSPEKKPAQVSGFSDILANNNDKVDSTLIVPTPDAGKIALVPNQFIKLGTISSKNPTVSNLLIRHPQYKKDCWRIIHAATNQNKPYTRIQAGTDIYYDPKTRELLWGDMVTATPPSPVEAATTNEKPLSEPADLPGTNGLSTAVVKTASEMNETVAPVKLDDNLVDAVRPMIGKAYEDVDCFELLVNGLSNMGFTYTGKNGLGRKLISMARDRGLPMNAYLNGEGLVKLSGDNVYERSFLRINHPEREALRTIEELGPYLKRGAVLSFSTETRGHTGVVSSRDGAWTFINSGVMDHSLENQRLPKGVGEEDLKKEIENWFKLAAKHGESLKITLGQLNEKKLASYYQPKKNVIA